MNSWEALELIVSLGFRLWSKEGPSLLPTALCRTQLIDFTFTSHFRALEKEMATHSSVLAWRIPETGEPGGLPSMGSHRVGHDWSDLAAAAASKRNNAKQEVPLFIIFFYTCLNLTLFFFYFILFLNLKHCISFAKHQNESATGKSGGYSVLLPTLTEVAEERNDGAEIPRLVPTFKLWKSGFRASSTDSKVSGNEMSLPYKSSW